MPHPELELFLQSIMTIYSVGGAEISLYHALMGMGTLDIFFNSVKPIT